MPDSATSPSILDQLVTRARRLYSLPAVAMKLLELTSQTQVDSRAIKECLERDPALTAKVLRVVNSSLFGLSRRVSDLNQALALLGVKPLKLLVLGFNLPDGLFQGVSADVLERYWRHALTKAVAARDLAENVWQMSGDEAFLAGLLQDLGMLVLLQELGEPYVRFLEGVQGDGGDLAAMEMSTLGFDHAVLSGRLFEHWGFPTSLVAAIQMPHDTERLATLPPAEQALPQILHLAELLSQLLAGGRPEALHELLLAGDRYRALGLPRVEEIVGQLEQKVRALSDVLSLRLSPAENYAVTLSQAHSALAEAAEQSITERKPGLERPEPDAAEAVWAETQGLMQAMQRFVNPAGKIRRDAPVTPANAEPVASTPGRKSVADPGLAGRLQAAVATCRQARSSVCLALIEIDHFDDLVLKRGWPTVRNIVKLLEAAITQAGESEQRCLPLTDHRFALILEHTDRQHGVEITRNIQRSLRAWSEERGELQGLVTLSVGVASVGLPPRNFPVQELIDAATRCLSGALTSGGDTVKSIDIC